MFVSELAVEGLMQRDTGSWRTELGPEDQPL